MSQVVKFETVEFHGKELKALSYNGVPYVAMRPLVESMGLDWSGQFRRVQRDSILNSSIVILATVAEDGLRKAGSSFISYMPRNHLKTNL